MSAIEPIDETQKAEARQHAVLRAFAKNEPLLVASSPACDKMRTKRKCPDTRSPLFPLQLGLPHGCNLIQRKNPVPPHLIQAGHHVRLWRRTWICTSRRQRREQGKGSTPLENLHGLSMLDPRGNPTEIVSKVCHRCCFHDMFFISQNTQAVKSWQWRVFAASSAETSVGCFIFERLRACGKIPWPTTDRAPGVPPTMRS